MTIVVETGAALPNSMSYISVSDADSYHAGRGQTAWVGEVADKEAALVRATAFVDATYRGRFPGYPSTGRLQALEWPRVGAYVTTPDNGRSNAFDFGAAHLGGGYGYGYWLQGTYYIAVNEIPREIKAAVAEAALRELTDPGALTPDLDRGNAISRLKAGPVEIAYSGAATATTVFQTIDLALASLLMPASPYGGKVARG